MEKDYEMEKKNIFTQLIYRGIPKFPQIPVCGIHNLAAFLPISFVELWLYLAR